MNQATFAAANILDKLRRVAEDPGLLRSYWSTYVLSRLVPADPEAYVISYPKCGRTWLRVMLQEYLTSLGYVLEDFHDKFFLRTPERQLVKFEHGMSNWVPTPSRVDQLSFDDSRWADERVLFLVRDPRDVLVSSWYHLRFRERIYKEGLSAFIRDDLVGIRKVIAFMNMWVENSEALEKFLLLRYEEMHADPHTSFGRVLEFLEVRVDPDSLADAVERSSFDRMRQREESGDLDEPWLSPGNEGDSRSMKVRQGNVGGYREELSDADVAFLDEIIGVELCPRLKRYYG